MTARALGGARAWGGVALLVGGLASAHPLLLSAEELKAQAKRAVILDARSEDQYEGGHIPGAINLPWIELSQMPRSAAIGAPKAMAEILTSRGIPSNRWVVVYAGGASGWGEEGRLYWTLAYLGHKDVSVLDGGFPVWKSASLPVSVEGPSVPSGTFTPKPVESIHATLEQVRLASEKGTATLIDARDEDEYKGAIKFDLPRGGHIPGAVNVPWKDLLGKDGLMLDKAQLRQKIASHKVPVDKPIYVYCTGGVRSGFVYLGLKVAGIKDVANYESSFWEWARDKSLPIATKD